MASCIHDPANASAESEADGPQEEGVDQHLQQGREYGLEHVGILGEPIPDNHTIGRTEHEQPGEDVAVVPEGEGGGNTDPREERNVSPLGSDVEQIGEPGVVTDGELAC